MTESIDASTNELVEEVQQERKDFDLLDRLVNRPKRDPQIVTLYMNEELGTKLGYVREEKNALGVPMGYSKSGLVGELHDEESKDEESRDGERIKALQEKIRETAAEIKRDSLTVTLQWIPPIAEELLQKESLEAVGLKSLPVPDNKLEEYQKEWFARALVSTLVSIMDNSTGARKDKLRLEEAASLRNYAPKEQQRQLDRALNALLNRAAISEEALDSADF
ncbi:hypothetical protein G7068_16155 [Leucobacter viscericola]|uniref:Uncharacterized protein n=1 Tax=Leucobacter viscericola TaxID=2714935 RepID=A0A6G7XBQ3_9MICO|nr:hypothetical protein [Leucobacter viscericola]QIK61798.1 hypothetical protein G7068_00165 [Leucobacter viscericola]QIK64580.1 hypothetical protein G7068_16155 [Leucobacter viscericola]